MGTDFLEKIEKLSYDKKKEVEDFVDFLIEKSKSEDQISLTNNEKSAFSELKGIRKYESAITIADKKPKLKREFGSLKGFVTFISDDFDAPLDDFKEHM